VASYAATATREGRWWVIDVEGIGVTQARSVAEAHEMAHALVVDMLDVTPESVDVVLSFQVPGLQSVVAEARRATEEAAAAQLRAAEGARDVARQLRERGLSASDVAAVLQVSKTRAQQLSRSA
jgi:hypothetical protein